MPRALLPSSAAAFAPRAPPIVVLSTEIPTWLTATVKRMNPVRLFKTHEQHTNYLRDILSPESATWILCSIMSEGLLEMIYAYVVYVDMVSQNEVAFKLTKETIRTLEGFYEKFLVDSASHMSNYTGKQAHLKSLQEKFVKAANEFVYRTNDEALKGLKEDGSGELLYTSSVDVKAKINRLFVPLKPPSRVVYIIRPLSSENRPRECNPGQLFESDSWNTQSHINTLGTEERLASSYSNSQHVSDAGQFPVEFAGSQLLTAVPLSSANASFDMSMYP